jgi:glycosyltransferase involved in cell wall biosynthesis
MTVQRAPTFSVIIPTHDRAPQVAKLVQRLARLDAAPDEIVVVDDGSSAEHADPLSGLEPLASVTRTPGAGPASARAEGVRASVGDWLVFLDDDDHPSPSWMSTFRQLVHATPDATFVSVAFERVVGATTSLVVPRPLGPAFSDQTANFLAGTFAVRRDLYLASGGFTPGLRCMEFTDLAMRVLARVAEGTGVATHDDTPTITVEVRDPVERSSQQPEVLSAAFDAVFARNGALFRRDRRFLANQYSTIGVAWVRAGHPAKGRWWLRRAAATRPSPSTIARLLAASVPVARRRVWGGTV